MTYYAIDESLAKRAKEANSFHEYIEGSATQGYREAVDAAFVFAEGQKKIVDPMYHDKIDSLISSYSKRLADNINERNRINASCPSVLIAGGSNFPVKKKEKQNSAWERNQAEFLEIQKILDKIKSIGAGGISSDDPNAIEKLKAKVTELEKEQAFAKSLNRYYKKNGTCVGFQDLDYAIAKKIDTQIKAQPSWEQKPYPPYELTSINGKIKRAKARIAELEAHREQTYEGWEFDGGRVAFNRESNRVQILFDEKPDDETRATLKENGFRWAPSQGAWQRMLNENGITAAKQVTEMF